MNYSHLLSNHGNYRPYTSNLTSRNTQTHFIEPSFDTEFQVPSLSSQIEQNGTDGTDGKDQDQNQPQMPRNSMSANRRMLRVSLACIPCRRRHVKCDSNLPTCSRCQSSARSCSYEASQRGKKARSGQNLRRSNPFSGQHYNRGFGRINFNRKEITNVPQLRDVDTSANAQVWSNPSYNQTEIPMASQTKTSEFLEIYHESFYLAHPFTLPFQFLMQRWREKADSVKHLILAMEYIGSLFTQSVRPKLWAISEDSESLLNSFPANGFTVQSLLIYAIAIYAEGEHEEARYFLSHAAEIALDIGMDSQSFSVSHGEGCQVLEESWRRTWWGLYVTDGVFTSTRLSSTFCLWNVNANVDLPCEDSDYQYGASSVDRLIRAKKIDWTQIIPQSNTLKDYDMREFEEDDTIFSSFTYLIDAARILGAVLAAIAKSAQSMDCDICDVNTNLVNWAIHLPKCKQFTCDENGNVDETLFLAHILFNTSKILLYCPQSLSSYNAFDYEFQLNTLTLKRHICCGLRGDHSYTVNALEAAEAIITLFNLQSSFIKHTPLVIWGLTVSLLVQISACTSILTDTAYLRARNRIRLGLGVGKILGEVWVSSRQAVAQVKQIAANVFAISYTPPTTTPARDVETFSSDNFDITDVLWNSLEDCIT